MNAAHDRAAAALHRVVIVGGGAAGLELATSLDDSLGRKGNAMVTLIDGPSSSPSGRFG
jgi:NADH dehydrogenase